MMMLEAASRLSDIKTNNLVKYLKTHPNIVKKLVNHKHVPEKIASFNLEIISSDTNAIKRSQQMKSQYGFLSNDALTLQVMKDLEINNIASNDADFETINFITLYKPSEASPVPRT